MKNSFSSLKTHPLPVNKSASMVFWKTPWWAEVPKKVKKVIFLSKLPEQKINVDYFRCPPKRGDGEKQITDRRGIAFRLDDGRIGIVTGYAGYRHTSSAMSLDRKKKTETSQFGKQFTSFDPNKLKRKKITRHRWYALISDGEFGYFKWSTINRLLRHNGVNSVKT